MRIIAIIGALLLSAVAAVPAPTARLDEREPQNYINYDNCDTRGCNSGNPGRCQVQGCGGGGGVFTHHRGRMAITLDIAVDS